MIYDYFKPVNVALCLSFPQAESKQTGRSVFRSALLNRLQSEYRNREEMRARSVQEWVCYVSFICNVFDYLRVSLKSVSTV